MKRTKYKFVLAVLFVMIVYVGLSCILQGILIAGEVSSLSGWFSITWGDSKDGKSCITYTLTDVNGQQTVLQIDERVAKSLGGVLKFNRKYVNVQGTLAIPIASAIPSALAVVNVISISPAPSPESQAPAINGATSLSAVIGSKPWVTIMCQFSDIAAQPNDRAYFLGMYGDTQPGLNHYWKELSFNAADVTGSTVAGTGWYTINTVATYNPGLCSSCTGSAGRTALFNDCTAAADADVDFSLYEGVNLMFNFDFDFGWAWGGSRTATLDGVTKSWSVTWEPPWSYADISVIAHEMGHGFGLPHSTAIDRTPGIPVYDSGWDVMSDDRYNCAAATDPTYGCMAQHTISYHKDLLGWIPGPRKTSVALGSSATVTLEDLAAPASSNYQMVKIPIGGSATHFYTVEARQFTGYDVKLPGEAVIIHDVDTTLDIPALLMPAGLGATDPGVKFTVGETFTDTANHIVVTVNAATTTGFEVTIYNGNIPPTCDANGPYTAECGGATTSLALDGTGSSDPDGGALTYSWSTSCPGGGFNDSTSATPILTLNSASTGASCNVTLTVTDSSGASSSCSATVNVVDTTPPYIICPANATIECDQPPPGSPTYSDACDASLTVQPGGSTVPGACLGASTLIRTWTVTDDAGNSASCSQVITYVDTTAPQVSVTNPPTNAAVQDGVTFKASASDNCGDVEKVFFSVREQNGGTGISIGYEDLAATFNSGTGLWEYHFDTTVLQDGYYVILAKAIDSCGNEGLSSIVPFSIRNWTEIEMLPMTPNSKAGRTMPVKFSIRIKASVDPAMPFVYNEDLEIRIYRCDNSSCSSRTLMQSSVYGDGSTDYRINGEMYIVNFKTDKKPATYVVEKWRPSNNFMIDSFTFKTVK